MDSENFLIIKDRKVFYSLKKNRRSRNLKIAVYKTGEVVVTAPFFLSPKRVKKILGKYQDWIYEQGGMPKNSHTSPSSLVHKDYLENKERAREIIIQRLDYFNQFYNFSLGRVFIRKQKTRWGSCSGKGNLNFNYKVVDLPEHLRDYIIVHELCHLQEFNHSPRFWDLVSRTIPEHGRFRKELKKHKFDYGF